MNSDFSHLPYRPCVGIMLLNAENRVFVGQRIDQKSEAWQMPQGGIDEGEAPRAAAFRELEEETGITAASIIAESHDWLPYDLPEEYIPKFWGGKYRGQTQKWFLMRFDGKDEDVNIQTHEPEFHSWKWITASELPEVIVPFKRELYAQVLKEFSEYDIL